MTEKTLILHNLFSLESLKLVILEKLNLYDMKRDCVTEFEVRLKSYIDLHPNQTIILKIDLEEVKKNIRKRVSGEVRGVRLPQELESEAQKLWGAETDMTVMEEKETENSMYASEFSRFQSGLLTIMLAHKTINISL